MKQEPAEPLLTLTPDQITELNQDGFLGALYRPQQDCFPGKVLILAGGSDGMFSLTRLVAEQYVRRGLSVLALAWWNRPGLPQSILRVPLEYGKCAAQWLVRRGFEKVAIGGISMGAAYALLCASYMPQLFQCVVAVNPICVCTQGFRKRRGRVALLDGPAFSYHGRDLPWAPLTFRVGRVLRDCLRFREVHLRSVYDRAAAQPDDRAAIAVEQIQCPILFQAAEQDAMWPSLESCRSMVRRLRDHQFRWPLFFEHYEMACHLLLPCTLRSRNLFRVEREHPAQCAASRQAATDALLSFLEIQW